LLALQLLKILARQPCERSADVLPDQLSRVLVWAVLGHLHLQLTPAELEVEQLFNVALRLRHLVASRDSEIDAPLANKRRDVRRGQEYERNRKIDT
jgi:hypothetical protein